MKDYIEERTLEIAKYILSEGATVRQAASIFGVSKSTVHTVLRISVGFIGCLNMWLK